VKKFEAPILRKLIWMGNSKKNILKFPDQVKKDIGDELQLVQFGGMPGSAKALKGVGSGVFETRVDYDTNTYRTVFGVKISKNIYVLHAFMKKSKKGAKTPNSDIQLIIDRYKEAKELAKYEEKK